MNRQMLSIGRILAFQARFQHEINPEFSSEQIDWDELFDCYCQESQIRPSEEERVSAIEFGRNLFNGAIERKSDIDAILDASLNKRTLKQTGMVERSILRIAAYEICFLKTAKAIVISEAIGLSKQFGAEGSASFINGVLDHVDKKR